MRYTHSLVIRVVLALLLLTVPTMIFNTNLFQYLFEGLTIKTVYFFLKIANIEAVIGNYGIRHAIDIYGEYTLNIVKYCVTASAYYLFTLLTILVYDVSILKRIKMLIFGYAAIFLMNIVRILILVITLIEKGTDSFATAHDILGTILAIFYVIIMWVMLSFAMGIKNMPVITDIRILIGEMMKKNEV
ncbi:MAG: pacearchaeosortase [Candidatus Nanoarchaeia archaeon]